MESYEIREVTTGYAERMRRLAIFDPLHELDRKREKDQNGHPIDIKGFGFLTLLFFFEQKLMRQYKTGVLELTEFLKKLSWETYRLEDQKLEQLARTIIEILRPSSGKKRTYRFYNWESGQEEEITYSILKDSGFDAKTNQQYYTLDEDGLELVFATKEFYSEFQLSISQLMLRKQLEKGEFRGALREINEMRIEMESLGERIIRVQHEVQRNIISEETYERYRHLLEDIHDRLTRENEEFQELRQFVRETMQRLYEQLNPKEESESYQLILKVTRELEEVHYDHTRLLDQSIELKNHTLAAAQESFYYTGIESFNFDQDVVARIISTPLPFEAMEGILHPFLGVEQTEQWSLLTIFGKQTIVNKEEEVRSSEFLTAEDDPKTSEELERLNVSYGKLMEKVLAYMQGKKTITLREIIEQIQLEQDDWLLEQRFFYDFWIMLHQRSPLKQSDEESEQVLQRTIEQLKDQSLVIQEEKEIIQVNKRFSIQNMRIQLEEEGDQYAS